jgi:hypothetical protein
MGRKSVPHGSSLPCHSRVTSLSSIGVHVVLGATSNYADGTIIHIIARVKTGGP